MCLTPRVCRLKAYNRNLKVIQRIKFFLRVGLVNPCAVTSASKRLWHWHLSKQCRLQSVDLFQEYSVYFQMHCAIIHTLFSTQILQWSLEYVAVAQSCEFYQINISILFFSSRKNVLSKCFCRLFCFSVKKKYIRTLFVCNVLD